MPLFSVWAPNATRVELEAGSRIPLKKHEGGWWSLILDTRDSPVDYRFLVDGRSPAFPDPRSRWQPEGVHKASRYLDPSLFCWSDNDWQAPPFSSAVVYELHIGTFTPEGTFSAAAHRLDYLKGLGVTHVELMPVANFAGSRGWGYDGVDLYAPFSGYGGPSGLQAFVNACHLAGLAVILDVVYNHLGPVGNYLSQFGPYFTDAHSTPWGAAVNLEQAGSHEVRRFLADNALMWLRDYHIDGLRLDAVHAFIDRSAIHFLEQLAVEVRQLETELNRHFVLIAESDLNNPALVTAREAGGFGLDAAWSDDFHHALFTVLTGENKGYYADFGSLAALAKSLEKVYVFNGNYSAFRERNHGRPVGLLPRHRFLGYIQNHDQVGNRAKGERLSHLVSLGRVKIAAAIVLCSPFVPLLFQGEEFAASAPFQYFTGFDDQEIGRLVSEGRTREFEAFGWKAEEIPDPQKEATFLRSKLDWSEVELPPHREVLDWYKELIRLRTNRTELLNDSPSATRVHYDEVQKWMIVERGSLCIACNLGTESISLDVGPVAQILLASEPSVRIHEGRIGLDPDTVAIYAVTAGLD